MNTRKSLQLILVVFYMTSLVPAHSMPHFKKGDTQENIVIGKKIRIVSQILKEWRPLEVYLPDNYERSEEPYPVMLVLDGDWAFRYCVSIVDMISPNYIPRMIVVGLPNTDRRRDLDPIRGGEQAERDTEKFVKFLNQELFVELAKKYRTRDYRILVGHSLAGLFTLYTFLKIPSLFDAFIASSPGLSLPGCLKYFGGLLDDLPTGSLSGKYLFYSAGGNEPEELHTGIYDFNDLLNSRLNPDLKWDFEIFEGEGHVPIRGFYQGVMNHFSGWIPELEFFRSGTLDYIKKHYKALTERFGFKILPPTPILNSVGRRFLRNNEFQSAIQLYKYFVELYPESSSGFMALADIYTRVDKADLAIQSLRKALDLEPDNEEAKKLLDELLKRNPLN
ncbi:alpha/beta hydrolase-fold protein [Acidobacteriota bacterium]